MTNRTMLVAVPKTPKESINPDRPASTLLRSQALHLQEALSKHVAQIAAILAINPRSLMTERQVSGYIKNVTAILHRQESKRPEK